MLSHSCSTEQKSPSFIANGKEEKKKAHKCDSDMSESPFLEAGRGGGGQVGAEIPIPAPRTVYSFQPRLVTYNYV